MPLAPQKFREIVFQVLYSADFAVPDVEEEIVLMLMKELKVTKRAVLEAQQKAHRVRAQLSEIDAKIRAASTNYRFERISRVEKIILRLGLYELFFEPALPPKIALAEAVRLTRKFGTPESAHFVNAILDVIYKQHVSSSSDQPVLA